MEGSWQLTAFTLPSAIATGIGLIVLRQVWPNRHIQGGTPLVAMILAIVLWALGQLGGTLSTTLEGKFAFARLQYPAIVTVPTAWFLFCLLFTGRLRWLARHWILLLPMPLATLAMALSNDHHGLIWQTGELVRVGDFVAWELTYGRGFALHTAWSYLLVGSGALILLVAMLNSNWHRHRALWMALAPAPVLACNGLYLIPDSPVRWLDITPLGFALAALAFSFAVRGQLLDLVPLSRDRVLREMSDAVIAVDRRGCVVDMNPAAERLTALTLQTAAGHSLPDLLAMPRSWLSEAVDGPPRELLLATPEGERAFEVAISALADADGETIGRSLILHDVTRRWQSEQRLRQLTDDLTRANQELELLATTDALTRLPNRRATLRLLEEELARARRYRRHLAVALIDLDGLRHVNEGHGLDTGDRMLQRVAQALDEARREGDLVGRLAGEEFLALLPETDARDAGIVAERLRKLVSAQRQQSPQGHFVSMTASIGVAVFDPDRTQSPDLLADAARALEGAKSAGVNRVGYA